MPKEGNTSPERGESRGNKRVENRENGGINMEEQEISLREYINVIIKRNWIILIIFLI